SPPESTPPGHTSSASTITGAGSSATATSAPRSNPPVIGNPFSLWKARTPRVVPDPQMPSTSTSTPRSDSICWTWRTSPPRSPSCRARQNGTSPCTISTGVCSTWYNTSPCPASPPPQALVTTPASRFVATGSLCRVTVVANVITRPSSCSTTSTSAASAADCTTTSAG